MRRLGNIASRAGVGFAVVWTITATAIIASAVLARNASDVLERTLVAYADDLMHASRAQWAAERMVAVGRGYLLTQEPELLTRAKDAERALDVALQALDRADMQTAERRLLADVRRSSAAYRQLLDSAFELQPSAQNLRGPANLLRERLLPAREILDVKLETLVAHKQRLQVAARQRATATAARVVRVTIGLGAVALVLSALLAGLFTSRLLETSRREQASARKATRALAERDELLGIVAHDLRSPLSAIGLRASSMVRRAVDRETTHSANAIQSTCTRMARLIESLVDAARIEAGGLSVGPERFRVDTVVQAAIETFAPAAREKSIRLQDEVEPPELAVWADPERLFQVLSNLVGNALKFTPEHGVVTISARDDKGRVRFAVSDTGSGIARQYLSRVFDRYWKSDLRNPKGAGLGLYIAKGIVEAHGGRIWVESTPGMGSSFQFVLPIPSVEDGTRQPVLLGTLSTTRTPQASLADGRQAHGRGL